MTSDQTHTLMDQLYARTIKNPDALNQYQGQLFFKKINFNTSSINVINYF